MTDERGTKSSYETGKLGENRATGDYGVGENFKQFAESSCATITILFLDFPFML